MASIGYPTLAKRAQLSDGTTYGYIAVPPASPAGLTFLLLHGYPSSSYDWRHQIVALQSAGYGIIAPDMVGYGDTDKPKDLHAYRLKALSRHMVELLDLEQVDQCIAVGHDWGCALASRLSSYHTDRFLGIVTLAVAYVEPMMALDIDTVCQLTQQLFGYPAYTYWKWHDTDDAPIECDQNPASAFSLFYPDDPDKFRTHLCVPDRASEFVRQGELFELPKWYPLDSYTIRDRIISRGGYSGPMSWYKAAMRGINQADESQIPEEQRPCRLPNLLVVGTRDAVTRHEINVAKSQEWVPRLQVATLDCGHWIPLEKPHEVSQLLRKFAQELLALEPAASVDLARSELDEATNMASSVVAT